MTSVRLLTYNVHGLRDDADALARVVRSAAPDLVFAQEAPHRLRWRTPCAELARRCGLFYAGGGGPAAGNLLMAGFRVRVVRTWSRRFPGAAGHHTRGVAFARCAVGGAEFVAAGTHLSTDPGRRLEQVARLAPALAGSPAPAVLGADLNESPDGPVWAELAAAGLRDTAAASGDGAGAAAPTFSVSAPGQRLDALLAGPQWTVKEYRVIDSPDARRASDHFPVLAELSLS